jgi:hypothetical protein
MVESLTSEMRLLYPEGFRRRADPAEGEVLSRLVAIIE